MSKIRIALLAIVGTAMLSGCTSTQPARTVALKGDSAERSERDTKLVSVRDTRGRLRHRVVRED